jgi:hypothetical protein
MKIGVQLPRKNSPFNGLNPNHNDLTWVQCKEFKCLAYLDETRKWINFYTGKKLKDFIKVIE